MVVFEMQWKGEDKSQMSCDRPSASHFRICWKPTLLCPVKGHCTFFLLDLGHRQWPNIVAGLRSLHLMPCCQPQQPSNSFGGGKGLGRVRKIIALSSVFTPSRRSPWHTCHCHHKVSKGITHFLTLSWGVFINYHHLSLISSHDQLISPHWGQFFPWENKVDQGSMGLTSANAKVHFTSLIERNLLSVMWPSLIFLPLILPPW